MTPAQSLSADLRPQSAVAGSVGFAGLCGLLVWTLIARQYGMDGPISGLMAVVSCGLPMVIWSLLYEKVHLRASTGIDWSKPRSWAAAKETANVKIVGLWITWGLIGGLYCIARWYWSGNYLFAMQVLGWAAPFLFALSVPYVWWLDRYLVDPRDGAWHFGQMLTGGREPFDREQIYHHLRAWMVKAFFTAFMLSIVPGGFGDLVRADFGAVLNNPVQLATMLITAMFVVDVQMATVGYILTMKPLDSHIRTANPYLAGWLAALICYPPFVLMGDNGPLNYHINTADWSFWLADYPALLWVWGGILVALTAIYAWATVAFGIRFSNLTHRGILTHGPYRWTKHPAYLSKNAFWWLSLMPFLATTGSYVDVIRNTALLAIVSGVYYWRARTEEAHLGADPAYQAYAAWMARNAVIPRTLASAGAAIRRFLEPKASVQPAE